MWHLVVNLYYIVYFCTFFCIFAVIKVVPNLNLIKFLKSARFAISKKVLHVWFGPFLRFLPPGLVFKFRRPWITTYSATEMLPQWPFFGPKLKIHLEGWYLYQKKAENAGITVERSPGQAKVRFLKIAIFKLCTFKTPKFDIEKLKFSN